MTLTFMMLTCLLALVTSASAEFTNNGEITLYTQMANKVTMMEQTVMPSGELEVKQWNRSSDLILAKQSLTGTDITTDYDNAERCLAVINPLHKLLETSSGKTDEISLAMVSVTDCLNQPELTWGVLVLWPTPSTLQYTLRLVQGVFVIINSLLGIVIIYKLCRHTAESTDDSSTAKARDCKESPEADDKLLVV